MFSIKAIMLLKIFNITFRKIIANSELEIISIRVHDGLQLEKLGKILKTMMERS